MKKTKNKRDLQREKNENYVVNEHLYKRLDSIIQMLGGIKFALQFRPTGKDITNDWNTFRGQARERSEKISMRIEKRKRDHIEDSHKKRELKLGGTAIIVSIVSACVSLASVIFSFALFYYYNRT